jgi:cytochrome d ubiquinol oxidase subunit II
MTLLLAILFTGYFVLAGLDYGVALVATGRRDLDRVSRFFLGNEVWLVAAVGLVFGIFPVNEGELLGAYRLPIGFALLGVVLVTAAFGLRIFTRHAGPGSGSAGSAWPAGGSSAGGAVSGGPAGGAASDAAGGGGTGALDGVARVGGAVAALGWGATLAAIGQGGDFRITPLVIASAIGMLAVLGVHGWAFLRRRWAVLFATTAALAGSVAVVGSTVTWHTASSTTVNLLAPMAFVLIPLLIVIQGATWWVFRERHVSEPSAGARTGSA